MISGQQSQFCLFCDCSPFEMSCAFALVTAVVNCSGKVLSKILLQLAVGHSVELLVCNLLDVAIPDS